jgi:hypothetical protein
MSSGSLLQVFCWLKTTALQGGPILETGTLQAKVIVRSSAYLRVSERKQADNPPPVFSFMN